MTTDTTYNALMGRLDPQQRAVAGWTPAAGNLRVVANAGSGKTSTLVALTARLVREGHVAPHDLVVVTFTKKAGEELKSRLAQVLPASVLTDIRVGTYHALGLQALKAEDPQFWNVSRCVDIPKRAQGVPSADELWRTICSFGTIPGLNRESLKLPLETKEYRKRIGLWRAHGADCFADVDTTGVDPEFAGDCELAWEAYTDAKARCRAWDFDDILEAWRRKVVREPAQRAVVLVDEAQDNNRTQLEIVQGLARDGGRICLIGDPKQNIYTFRGAYPDLFREAEQRIGAATLEICTNYRSAPHIVAFANAFVAGKPWNPSSPSVSFRQADDQPVHRRNFGDAHHEADDVATRIADGLIDGSAKPGDYAILCRTNAARMAFETALIARNIPVVVLGAKSAFETREAKVVLAYLTLSQQDSVEALDTVLNTPKRYIPRSIISDVHTYVAGGASLATALQRAGNSTRVKPASRRSVDALVRQLARLRSLAWADVAAEVRNILTPWLEGDEADNDAVEADTATALVDATLSLTAMFPSAAALCEFTARCANGTQSRAEGEDPGNCVTIATIHKVKGLEWPHVFVAASANVLPHARTDNPEEEERLFYVAVTRARDTLTITGNSPAGGLTPFAD
jgi:superfamily I DNA/RNA helicase